MRKSALIGGLATALASMVLVLPPPAVSAAPGGGGGGGGGSGEVYADLFVALRDEDGVPILSETFYEEGPVTVTCIQPISYAAIPSDPADPSSPSLPSTPNPADGRDVYLVPLQGEASLDGGDPVPEDTACAPQTEFVPYVSEVELERLNLVRTSDEVLWKKLAEVGTRLATADDITLDGAGRITTWTTDPLTLDPISAAIDASPDQAAIYAATEGLNPAPPPAAGDGPTEVGEPGGLMDTGTIPHWLAGPPPVAEYPLGNPAQIVQGSGGFDNWMLAASAVGTAAGKPVPITIDTIQYYNRTAAKDGDVANWGYVSTLPSVANGDGLFAGDPPPEEFVDYSDFEYTRADVFEGCTTWLDVGTLTWMSGPILDRVEFIDIVEFASPTAKVTNVAGFAQLADDVRSVIGYLHENEVVIDENGVGFFIDPVFTETCAAQEEMVVELNQPVDAVDPTVAITVAPPAETQSTTATFEFVATDAASVLCVLDSGTIERCTSPKTYTGLELGTHTFNVIAMGVAGNFVSDTYTWQIIRPGEDSMIVSMDPVRFADTRPGWVAADGLFYGTGPVPAGGTIQVPVAGRGGVPVDAKAVVANVTVVGAASPGFVTVFPCGTRPGTSSVNYLAGEAVANEVIAKLSPVGSICVYAHSAVNVIVDVAGYVPVSSDYVALTPARLIDTRPTPVAAGKFIEVPVAGRGGVAVDAKAVVANVTVVGAAIPGFVTVFPCGTRPGTSSVNYLAGEAVANEVIAKLSPVGSICVYAHSAVNVIVDVAGYVPVSSDYVALTPARLIDTRPTPVAAGKFIEVPVAGRGGVAVDAKAVVANVTVVGAAIPGFVTVFPCGTRPGTSSVNYLAGEAVANEVIAKLSPVGSICVYAHSAVNVIVDVTGSL